MGDELAAAKQAVMAQYIGEPAHVDRLIEAAQRDGVARRRELAETLQTIDFADDVQSFLDALDDERDTPGDCKDSTRQLDALIAAVVRKCFSEIK